MNPLTNYAILHNLLANGKINFSLLCLNIKHQIESRHLAIETLMSNQNPDVCPKTSFISFPS